MMTTEYHCDFCNIKLTPDRNGIPKPFTAFDIDERSANHRCINPPSDERRFIEKPEDQSTWHLCHRCLSGLVALARRTLPSGAFRDVVLAPTTERSPTDDEVIADLIENRAMTRKAPDVPATGRTEPDQYDQRHSVSGSP